MCRTVAVAFLMPAITLTPLGAVVSRATSLLWHCCFRLSYGSRLRIKETDLNHEYLIVKQKSWEVCGVVDILMIGGGLSISEDTRYFTTYGWHFVY